MTQKERIIRAMERLPANATYSDAMERIVLIAKIEKGIEQADSGETFFQEQARQRLNKYHF